jgi:uncharacterized protein YndB with AHSA1/START domain
MRGSSMTTKNLTAQSSIQINNTIDEAWKALIDPEIVEKYMLGSQQLSDWKKGSSIIWKKDFNGRQFVDRGAILEITPPKHFLSVTSYGLKQVFQAARAASSWSF